MHNQITTNSGRRICLNMSPKGTPAAARSVGGNRRPANWNAYATDGTSNSSIFACQPEQRTHSEEIAERSAEQDREAEAPERGTGDPADVGFAQREEPLEITHNVTANRERHGRRDEGYAARAEQPVCGRRLRGRGERRSPHEHAHHA